MKTYNLECVKGLIMGLIEMEETLEHKHDLLTDIGIGSRHPTTFKACEEIRNDLPDSPDQTKRENSVVASGPSRKKVGNVLHKNPSDAAPIENNSRAELEAILSALKTSKQTTFEFKGVVFALPLIRAFVNKCKNLPQLEITVEASANESHMFLNWGTGTAKINSFAVAEKIKQEKALAELLK